MLFYLLYSLKGFNQQFYLTKETRSLISAQCSFCSSHVRDSASIIKNGDNQPEITFHNCHVYFFNDQLDSAYKYELRAVSDLDNRKDSNQLIFTSYIKVRILTSKQLYAEALNTALLLFSKPNLPTALEIDLYSTVGTIYLIQNDYHSSLKNLLFCLNHFDVKDSIVLKTLYNNIAVDYLLIKKETIAEKYFEKSIAISLLLKDTIGVGSTYTNIANLYYNNYQDIPAIKYFKKALSTALSTHDHKLKQEAYLILLSHHWKNDKN